MAVNQSPLYQKAEERYRAATSPAERVAALEEMLRLVPKHKASEKLQAQLKQKLKAAREEAQGGSHHKPAAGHHDIYHAPRQGAGQVVLLGEPNTGKSSILAALTSARVEVADFPFSTHAAVPGMAHHEDVPVQLVDMPPLLPGHDPPGMIAPYRGADVILLVIDLSALDLIDQYERPLAWLRAHRLEPVSETPRELEPAAEETPPALSKRTLVAANKADTSGAPGNLEGLKELIDHPLPLLPIAAARSEGLAQMMAAVFDALGVIRVYAKKPGKPADMSSPFILPRGGTVHDVARLVHRELAEKLKSARVWGADVHDGQHVHGTHVLADKCVVELHFP